MIEVGGKAGPYASPLVCDVVSCGQGRILLFAFLLGMGYDLAQADVHLTCIQPPDGLANEMP